MYLKLYFLDSINFKSLSVFVHRFRLLCRGYDKRSKDNRFKMSHSVDIANNHVALIEIKKYAVTLGTEFLSNVQGKMGKTLFYRQSKGRE